MSDDPRSRREQRERLARWVAQEVLPGEAGVRRWLARGGRLTPDDIDELIQEAYCRLSMLDGVDHIDAPAAYFFSIVRNLLLRRLKRRQVVPFEAVAEIETFADDHPSPEQVVAGRLAYDKVLALIARLPERCQRIVRLRKIEGWSQRRIAEHLSTTEKAVEKQIWLGVRMVREAWRTSHEEADRDHDYPRRRQGDGR